MRLIKSGLTRKSRVCMWVSLTGCGIMLFMLINGYNRTHEVIWLVTVAVTAGILAYDRFTRKGA